jgi:hypothetical protein
MVGTPTTRTGRIALVVLLVALAGCSASLPGNDVGGGAPEAGDGASGPGGGGTSGGSYYVDEERVVVREADMRLEIEEFDPAFDEARAVARDHDGFVADWTHDVERGWHSGDLVVRVPAENFTDARDDLAELGELEDETVRARDFTNTYTDLGERLSDLRRDERELERLLNETGDAEEARRVRSDLAAARQQIRELENRRGDIERREALSTIRLSLHEPPGERPPKNYQSAFGFDDAFLDAFHGGLTVVKWVVVLFGYAIPVAVAGLLLAALAFVCFRAWRLTRANLERLLPEVGAGRESPPDESGD